MHAPAYRDRILRGPANGPPTHELARLAAGGVVAAVDAIMTDAGPTSVFCAVRPPGHHANADQARGLCRFNNVAVAARHAQRRHGIERVLILDWDAHHADGTAAIFADDPTVLVVSLHQWPLYPGSGWHTEVGHGAGAGYTVNIPLLPGAGDAVYQAAFRRIIEPIAEQFAPALVLVSAGQDAHHTNPLSDLTITTGGFQWLERAVRRIADRHCGGRHVLALEDGYDRHADPAVVTAVVAAMGDFPCAADEGVSSDLSSPLTSADDARLRDVATSLAPYWRLG